MRVIPILIRLAIDRLVRVILCPIVAILRRLPLMLIFLCLTFDIDFTQINHLHGDTENEGFYNGKNRKDLQRRSTYG